MKITVRHLLAGTFKTMVWGIGILVSLLPRFIRRSRDRVIIARLDAIGDFVLFTPCLSHLRRKYQAAEITLVVEKKALPLAVACPHVDEVYGIDTQVFRSSAFYRLANLVRMAVKAPSVFVNPVFSREQIVDELALWSRAETKIAWDGDLSNLSESEKRRGNRIYSTLITSLASGPIHESERNAEFLSRIGVEVSSYAFELWGSSSSALMAEELWDTHSLTARTVIALVPGSLHSFKSWGVEKFSSLIDEIAKLRPDALFVVIGGEAEKESAVNLVGAHPDRVLDLCGETSLDQLGPIFGRCRLVVGNDTGPLHIAVAAGAPTVGIVGGGHFGRFLPYQGPASKWNASPRVANWPMLCYGCNWKCIYEVAGGEAVPCIAGIDVQAVLELVKPMLSAET